MLHSYREANSVMNAVASIVGSSYQRGFVSEPVTAFFDESGKLADGKVVCFGGIVAKQSKAIAFADTWVSILAREHIPHFSMKEAMNFRGPFETWSNRSADRDRLLMDLLLTTSSVNRIQCGMTADTFKAMNPDQRKGFKDPAYMLFEGCVKIVTSRNPGLGIAVTYDLSEEYSEKCVKLYNDIRRRWPEIKRQCFSIAFMDDEFVPQLQAADMLAYLQRASLLSESKKPEPIIAEMITVIERAREVQDVWYEDHQLGSALITPPTGNK